MKKTVILKSFNWEHQQRLNSSNIWDEVGKPSATCKIIPFCIIALLGNLDAPSFPLYINAWTMVDYDSENANSTKFNVWRHDPLFGYWHPWKRLINSLCYYLLVISILVCNGLVGHFQGEVFICIACLHIYLPHAV